MLLSKGWRGVRWIVYADWPLRGVEFLGVTPELICRRLRKRASVASSPNVACQVHRSFEGEWITRSSERRSHECPVEAPVRARRQFAGSPSPRTGAQRVLCDDLPPPDESRIVRHRNQSVQRGQTTPRARHLPTLPQHRRSSDTSSRSVSRGDRLVRTQSARVARLVVRHTSRTKDHAD